MEGFDPEGTFLKEASIFGFPKNSKAQLTLLPAPWEPTTSFKKGTARGPKALFEASKQMDLYHPFFRKVYEKGFKWNFDLDKQVEKLNALATPSALKVKSALESNLTPSKEDLTYVNQLSHKFNELIYTESLKEISKGKTVGLVGGDHSCPFGLIKALSETHKEFAILHIDAHFDLRNAYQGFEHSHASIFYNVSNLLQPNTPYLFQLGLRDFCESELNFAQKHSTFLLDQELQYQKACGKSFHSVFKDFSSTLPKNIYISFDIDGLSPDCCPHTGTPVPGGLKYEEAIFMIQSLFERDHKLIGFDLCEVSPSSTGTLGEGLDETLGVRILYELSCFALASY